MITNLDDYQRLAQQLAAIPTGPCLGASAAIEELVAEVQRLRGEVERLINGNEVTADERLG